MMDFKSFSTNTCLIYGVDISPVILNIYMYIYFGLLMYMYNTLGRLLIMWFNDCILDKLGQIVNPMIAKVDPIHIHACLCLESNNYECRKNS